MSGGRKTCWQREEVDGRGASGRPGGVRGSISGSGCNRGRRRLQGAADGGKRQFTELGRITKMSPERCRWAEIWR